MFTIPTHPAHSILRILLLLLLLNLPATGTLSVAPEPAVEVAPRTELLELYSVRIAQLNFDYRQIGSVLEALAYLQFAENLYPPPQYEIYSGVQYFAPDGRTIGELDILVWDSTRKLVVEIYEVKLTGNLRSAGQLASAQLRRFERSLVAGEISRTSARIGGEAELTPEDFAPDLRFGRIGPKGATREGWDYEIDLTREEGDVLQALVLERIQSPPAESE